MSLGNRQDKPYSCESQGKGTRRGFLLLTAVLFAGCATVYNPRSDPPDVVAVSAAAPAQAAGCSNPHTRSSSRRVRATTGGSRLELYSLWNWVETLRPALAACGEVS
jgi:hypothetical protein